MSWWQLVRTEPHPKHKVAIAPSLLSANFSRLPEEIESVRQAGADFLHLDVMDGHFVPNLTFGPFIVGAIRRLSKLPLDAHLMIDSPDKYIPHFMENGADILTIHVEASSDIPRDLKMIRKLGGKSGITLNPDTPLEPVLRFLEDVDLLLLMSVFPGFSGQEFMDTVIDRISMARSFREKEGLSFAIEVDGGIKPETAKRVREVGADILVAGTAVFKRPDYRQAILELRGETDED